jgi:hypothetical protein
VKLLRSHCQESNILDIQGRIGEDRGTILDMGRIPGYHTRFPAPLALPQGQKSDPDSPPYSPVTEDDEPGEPAPKRSKSSSTVIDRNYSTVIDSRPFSPMNDGV